MMIDEVIAGFRYSAEILKSVEEERIAHDSDYNSTECEQIAEWLEELKAIKELDLEIPQHFTKEQSDWIKAYVILKRKEAKVEAIDEFIKRIEKNQQENWIDNLEYGITFEDLEKVAEQMKDSKR